MIRWIPDGKWSPGSTAVVATKGECVALVLKGDRKENLDLLRIFIHRKIKSVAFRRIVERCDNIV